MKLNQKFSHLFFSILKSEKKTTTLLNIIQKYYDEKTLDKELVLCLIKSLILILSYYPKKIDIIIDILNKYNECNIAKRDIYELLKRINLEKQYTLEDYLINKIIFTTFELMELLLEKNKVIFRIWYDILHSSIKIKTINKIFKINIYINYIKEAIKIINENDNGQIYLKILNYCSKITKEINQYLSQD